MAVIPLGSSAYRRTDGFVPEVRVLNMYMEPDTSGLSPDKTLRIQRPGLVKINDYGQIIRAANIRPSDGASYVVSGSTLYVNTAPLTGTINGSGLASIVFTNTAAAIRGGTTLYLASPGDPAAVVMPNDAPSGGAIQDIDQVNSYILALLPNGRFYWIVPGATTVDALNFATAESSPDAGIAIRRMGDEFLIFGLNTIEVWQVTGDTDAPFQRASGRLMERGCFARDTVQRFDNTIVFVGDDCIVYRISAVPLAISDNGISERIRNRSGELSAWTCSLDGHEFYILKIPGQGDYAYDALTKLWSEWGSPGQSGWNAWVGFGDGSTIYAGSAADGSLWHVTPSAINDDGAPFERLLTATVPILGKMPRNDSFTIGTGTSADATIRLRWKDGQDDYPDYYDEIPVNAGIDVGTMYRLGQPDQPYRTFEVSCVDNVRLRIAGALVNQGWN